MRSCISETVDLESNIIGTSVLPISPVRTAALDRTAAVITFTTLGGPIAFRNAPGPCGTSPCRFPTGNPLPGVQTGHARNTALDLDNSAANALAGGNDNTDVPRLIG